MIIIGVMGGGSASQESIECAYELGRLIASEGWVLLNGGRAAGIMEASAKGAREAGGLTVGVLPDMDTSQTSDYIDIPILTGMNAARNYINVLSSQVVVACPGGAGTLSEIALAMKSKRPVICMGWDPGPVVAAMAPQGMFFLAATPDEIIGMIKDLLK
ncbi:MAG: TIGR00725 family protein [Desulfatibacillum sp.]|nr:TIGR00725 family protein [Desulfatibacillum sp.]